MAKLIRFWFEFDRNDLLMAVRLGCGVTAWNYDDAIHILKEEIFRDAPFPKIKKVKEDIDVSTLDQGHILPNMLPPNVRGVWYPIGYSTL
ncbi:MAG TPA: hypothetical protein VL442_14645 [Mucilaginibacter sp.]|jgi:hypothetical protein|nr:hypothetical protein [Mucilaginibacter sp.]